MKKLTLVMAIAATGVMAGCVDKSAYESNPVQIKTEKGVVTCQLYMRDRVQWDEAIAVPAGMTKDEGDAYCVQEGHRQFNAAHNRVGASG
ncbi:hypothetical protein [Aliiroseovarius sp. S1123]|jgi:hypothetical protein|uniref:hypothetical protein n=1 Tax=unclassified Aliiroseovarius TaxID=2623558 RepID=UPI001FF14A42|nr:hypothetical protein [Aliiroseovarius sp. S1123]MCK0170607.1 hypothetical protein [Aliiroseovarius sp. S1123]